MYWLDNFYTNHCCPSSSAMAERPCKFQMEGVSPTNHCCPFVWYHNIRSALFLLSQSTHVTNRQNYDSQDRTSIATSCGKNRKQYDRCNKKSKGCFLWDTLYINCTCLLLGATQAEDHNAVTARLNALFLLHASRQACRTSTNAVSSPVVDFRVPTPPGKSWNLFCKISSPSGPEICWKAMTRTRKYWHPHISSFRDSFLQW